MADCPGVLHLAEMADGGLARLRVPGGSLSVAQARAVADAAARLGSGVVDLTNRANLQIRGIAGGAGPALALALEASGFRFHGEADRRRNVLLDPFAGIDPEEVRDLRALAAALDEALVAAPWIGGLSPKFSFVLDGGGASGVSAVPSDVVALAVKDGVEITVAGFRVAVSEPEALASMLALAEAAARSGSDVRFADLDDATLRRALGDAVRVAPAEGSSRPAAVASRHGVVETGSGSRVAVAFTVPVGRLDGGMIRFLAAAAETEGEGRIVLAPWSVVVVPGVDRSRAADLIGHATAAGFVPPAVADRLSVVACSGSPACARAREPAKTLAAEVLKLAAAEPDRLPARRRSLHLSACPKGCAGSAPADLLLLGESDRDGWSIHAAAAPRSAGKSLGLARRISPAELLARLAR